MRRSAGAALATLILVLALSSIASPAHARFAFPAFGLDFTDSIVSDIAAQSADAPLRSIAIDQSYDGKSFGAQKNEVLVVQLDESDPSQTWKYTGKGNFVIVGETVLESYPVRHDFRVKVKGPGDLTFAKVDSRSGDIVGRFGVRVVIEEPEPKAVVTRYPLFDFGAVGDSPGLLSLWR